MDKMAGAVGNLSQTFSNLQSKLADSARVTKDYAKISNQADDAVSNLGNSMNVFDRSVKQNLNSLRENRRALEQYDFALKNVELRTRAAEFATQHWTKKVADLGTVFHAATSKIVAGVKDMASWLDHGTNSLGNLKKELADFRRMQIEVARSSSVMGNERVLTSAFWDDLKKSTYLSQRQFLEMQNTMFQMSQTVPLMDRDFVNFAKTLHDQFGPSADRIKEVSNRFTEMENTLPGVRGELRKMQRMGDPGLINTDKMASMTLLMSQLGTNIRDLDLMNQYVKPMTLAEEKVVKFEAAIQKEQQALQDLNTNTAKSAEDAMIKMAKLMTTIVRKIDDILKKFDMLPKAFIYISAIAGTAFGGMVRGVMGLTRYIQQLNASILQTQGLIKGVGVAGAGMGRGMGMAGGSMATIGATAIAGYNVYSGVQKGRGGAALGKGAGIEERYAAEAGRTSGYGQVAGTLLGGGLGLALGGPVGAMLGAGIGGMAGEYIGGKFGSDKEEAAGYAKVEAALDRKGLKVKEIIRSEEGILRAINEQSSVEKKTIAIRAIIEDGIKTEAELRALAVKNGQKEIVQLIEMKKGHEGIMKAQEKARKTALDNIRQLTMQMNILKVVEKTFGGIAQHSTAIGETLMETWAVGLVGDEFKRAAEYSGMVLQELNKSSKVLEKLYSTRKKEVGLQSAAAGAGALIQGTGIGGAAAEGLTRDFENLLRAKQKLDKIPVADEEEYSAAKESLKKFKEILGTRIDELGANKKIKDELKGIVESTESQYDRLLKSSDILAKMVLQEQIIATAKKTQEAGMRAITGDADTAVGVMDAQLRIQRLQASVAEKTAAGYAVSYAHQKQIYDTLVKQRGVQTQSLDNLQKSAGARLYKDFGEGLKKAGVSMGELGDLGKNYDNILQKINTAKAKDKSNEMALASAASAVGNELKGQLGKHEQILALQEQELEMAMNLREGYLDVINEMTTGRDMMSQMLPDANRGIMALQELSMRSKGQDFGGAMQRGFVSFKPFAESQDISGAPKFTRQGFTPPSRSGAVMEYQRQVERMLNANARGGGPGNFAGQANLNMSAAYGTGPSAGVGPAQTLNTVKTDVHTNAVMMRDTTMNVDRVSINAKNIDRMTNVPNAPSPGGGPNTAKNAAPGLPLQGKAVGGMIPGTPSDRDNMMGVVDGRRAIGLASGEYVVNARATQKFLPLLEKLNSSGGVDSSAYGLQGGGEATKALMNKWAVTPESMVLAAAKRGEPGAYEALVEKYKGHPGDRLPARLRAWNDIKFSRGAAHLGQSYKELAEEVPLAIVGSVASGTASGYTKARGIHERAYEIALEKGVGAIAGVAGVASSLLRDTKSVSTAERDTARAAKNNAAGAVWRRKHDLQKGKMKIILREMMVRPGLKEFAFRKTGGKMSYSNVISAYDEFMAGRGARQDALIADKSEIRAFLRPRQTERVKAMGRYIESLQSGVPPEEAKRAAFLEATKGPLFSSWKKTKANLSKMPDLAMPGDVEEIDPEWTTIRGRRKRSAQPMVMGKTISEWKKENRKNKLKLGDIYEGSKKIKGLAGGGSVGISTLAAMMSGTVNIGSLNVNGQALARNLSGANDMSIAMEQARQNHYT